MPRPALRPLDYVTVQTRLPLFMYKSFIVQAARHSMDRMQVYMYALRFAYQSGKEFTTFLDTIQEKQAQHDNSSKLPTSKG